MVKFLRNISLKTRLILGIGSMVLPMIVIGGSTIAMFHEAISTFKQTEEVRRERLFPLVALDSSLTEALDYVDQLQTDEGDLSQKKQAWIPLKAAIDRDFAFVSKFPEILPIQNALLHSIENDVMQGSLALEEIFSDPNLSTARRRDILQKKVQQRLNDALTAVRTIHYSVTAWTANENTRRAEEFDLRFRWMILLIFIIILAIALLAALVLSRSILKPMTQLKEGLARFSQGDLSYRIQMETHDELEELAIAMNAMASNLEESQKKLQELAIRDGLTGLFNRREFNRLLHIEVERAIRDRQMVSMVMVDLDHFKSLNDTYGHQSGDQALAFVADILMREVRPGDYAARFGGEEFAIILPNANIQDALAVAERIRGMISEYEVPLATQKNIQITASLGCATFPSHAQSELSLLTQADKALYQAKKNGRNQVVPAQPLVTNGTYL